MKNEEIDEMIKEAPGPINFTVFLTMFGEKLKGKWPICGMCTGLLKRKCHMLVFVCAQVTVFIFESEKEPEARVGKLYCSETCPVPDSMLSISFYLI